MSRDSEAHKFAGPAPSRPAGLAARTRRRAWRWDSRKCCPAAYPNRVWLRPAARSGPVVWAQRHQDPPPGLAQPSPALGKAQCAGAEPCSAAAGGPAPYYACAGLGGGTFCLVWRVAERFLMFSLDVAEPGGVCQSRVSWCCFRKSHLFHPSGMAGKGWSQSAPCPSCRVE